MTDQARYPSLENRAVLITGGATGIGAAFVEHFARQGATVSYTHLTLPTILLV